MIVFLRYSLRWIGLVVAAGLSVGVPAECAQDEADIPEVAPVEQAPPSMTKEQYVQWIDQTVLGSSEGSLEVRAQLETILALKIEYLDRACGITGSQKRKLELAGRGDVKRFFDAVDEHRQRYDAVKNRQQAFAKLQTEVQALANRRGKQLFDEASIFAKTLSKMLTAEQTARIDTAARRSRSFRHRAKVDLVVQSLDVLAGLRDEQRRRLTELLVRETRPARNSLADFDVEIVIAQAAQLPESKIRPVFDDDQWRSVAPVLQTLKQNYHELLHDVQLAGKDESGLDPSDRVEVPPAPADRDKSPGNH
jgi:hypothetical protein